MSDALQTQPVVRQEVLRLLDRSEAFRSLPRSKQADLAQHMSKVGSYLAADRGWLQQGQAEHQAAEPVAALARSIEATALAEGDDADKGAVTDGVRHQLVGDDFRAASMEQGTKSFENLVDTVDFPAFVSGLVQGVFQAIIDASIQQMEAYGELLAATAKTVGDFADDHISMSHAREQLVQRHPSGLALVDGKLALTSTGEDNNVLAAYAKGGSTDLDDAQTEERIVNDMRLKMAQQRQKMLAIMVLMGINRIVVTNGRINAKVVFDVKTTDTAQRDFSHDKSSRSSRSAGAAAAGWAPWGAAGGYAKSSHRTMVKSSLDENSTANAEAKARLSGDVRVNFRSETLPPERMMDALQMGQLQNLAGSSAPTGGT